MSTSIVEVTNLHKTYILGKIPVEALRGVNLRVVLQMKDGELMP